MTGQILGDRHRPRIMLSNPCQLSIQVVQTARHQMREDQVPRFGLRDETTDGRRPGMQVRRDTARVLPRWVDRINQPGSSSRDSCTAVIGTAGRRPVPISTWNGPLRQRPSIGIGHCDRRDRICARELHLPRRRAGDPSSKTTGRGGGSRNMTQSRASGHRTRTFGICWATRSGPWGCFGAAAFDSNSGVRRKRRSRSPASRRRSRP